MDLLDELVAVNVTLRKWEENLKKTNLLTNYIANPCGFCDLYNCAEDTCPAFDRCNKMSVIYDALHTIGVEAKKNISWLMKRATRLTKKIKVKSDAD